MRRESTGSSKVGFAFILILDVLMDFFEFRRTRKGFRIVEPERARHEKISSEIFEDLRSSHPPGLMTCRISSSSKVGFASLLFLEVLADFFEFRRTSRSEV
jgi:hypothetical protein